MQKTSTGLVKCKVVPVLSALRLSVDIEVFPENELVAVQEEVYQALSSCFGWLCISQQSCGHLQQDILVKRSTCSGWLFRTYDFAYMLQHYS